MALPAPKLQRSLGLFQSTVLNMIDMVGIGPFLTLPMVIGLAGSQFLYAWLAGAFLSLVDAMIWSELGASYPLAGGSYNFLKEAYGRNGPGKMISFLYVWQTIIQAPLVAASAAIGFSKYLTYLVHLNEWQQKAVSGTVIIFVTFLLYRKIDNIGKIGVLLWSGVLLIMGWIIFGGITSGHFFDPVKEAANSFDWEQILSFFFGQACVKTVYSYLGYYNVCHLGGEINNPGKNIPRSMFISIFGIAILYLAMNMSVTSIPQTSWQKIIATSVNGENPYIISTFIKTLYGSVAANIATVLVLWVALASLFAVMLGYSRVPYAAAVDGAFFKIFAKLHSTKNFPYVSLLFLAVLAFLFSLLFRMGQVIDAILAMRILLQFIGQAIGVVLLRIRKGTGHLPYKMPLYPLPVILAVFLWILIFISTGKKVIGYFSLVFGCGIIVYLTHSSLKKQWPFHKKP